MNITPPNFNPHILPTDRQGIPHPAAAQNNDEIQSLIGACLDQTQELLKLLPSSSKEG